VQEFDDVVAVDGIDIEMPPGEFFTLLGPSGCGKTTTLRMIAGFERPTSGRILLDGQRRRAVPPHQRNVNTVFQSYALFPHLDVAKNVAFGLKYHKLSKEERRQAGGRGARARQLQGFAQRKAVAALGGQQQRVALARALVLRRACCCSTSRSARSTPQLRKDLQVELKALQASSGSRSCSSPTTRRRR
jgi:spermidine/putrescine transport system ATP-binding protein